MTEGPSWSWSYSSWIYNYLCYQCLSPLTSVRIPLGRDVLDITLCDEVCQWLVAWFSPGILVSSTHKTEILLNVALNSIPPHFKKFRSHKIKLKINIFLIASRFDLIPDVCWPMNLWLLFNVCFFLLTNFKVHMAKVYHLVFVQMEPNLAALTLS